MRLLFLMMGGFVLFPFLSVAEHSDRVELEGPEVTKISWNMRSLFSRDVNDDGLLDLIMINNNESKIELLLQRKPGEKVKSVHRALRVNRWEPNFEDSRFVRESIVSGITMYAIAAGDLNGDGLMDLVYTGKGDPLTFRYQLKEGGFSEKEVYDKLNPVAWTSTIVVSDINGDKREDLVVMGKEKIIIFYQEKEGLGVDPVEIRLTNKVSYGLKVTDINQDNKLDILYLENNTDRPSISKISGFPSLFTSPTSIIS